VRTRLDSASFIIFIFLPTNNIIILNIMMRVSSFILVIFASATSACPYLKSRRLQGMGGGGGHGGGNGAGKGDENSPSVLINQLFANHEQIDREVEYNNDGTIRTITSSINSTMVSLLQDHVEQMQDRSEENMQVRAWDPFFVELFERHNELRMDVTNLDNGVEVHLSANTDCGQALIESHTAVVTLFVETGQEEGMKSHDVPAICLESDAAEESEVGIDEESDLDSMMEDDAAMESEGEFATTTNNSIILGDNNTLVEDEESTKTASTESEVSSASLACVLPVSFLLMSFLVMCSSMY